MSIVDAYPSWQVIGREVLTGAASSLPIINIPACSLLRITVMVTGYGGGDIASLRFGGTAGAVDTGNNYETRYIRMNSGANNNFTNVVTNNTNFLRLGSQNITLGRSVEVIVTNNATTRKICRITAAPEAGGSGTEPSLDVGQGIWANTAAQAITVQLITAGGNTMLAGTQIIVEGLLS